MLIHKTHRYTHRVPVLPKIIGCMGCQQSCKWRDEGGGRRKITHNSCRKHCCAASSAECAVGGRDGWRLGKSSDGVVMIGMCLRTGGIPRTAGSWQLGKGEKCQRWMMRRQLGS